MLSQINFNADPGFGVYIHWPFCAAKCPYCDFNSHVRHQAIDQPRFVKAFARELAHQARLTPGRTVNSIFFGGGTPSLMEPRTVGGILDAIAAAWPVDPQAEITLEANPTSVEANRFAGYRGAGVNRVSLGMQALCDNALRDLGRRHTADEARAALDTACALFERVSCDLIYARPNQTLKRWRSELREVLDRTTEHLSLYQLTIEEGTPYAAMNARGLLDMPDPDLARAFYEITLDITAKAGRPAYEISNFARPGAECRHNLIYWRYGDYAGVGPGAHARLAVQGRKLALMAEKNPERWLAQVEERGEGAADMDWLETEQQGDELLLMGLRLAEGIDLSRYTALAGRDIDPRRLQSLEAQHFITRLGPNRIRATHEGWMVLDAVVADLAV